MGKPLVPVACAARQLLGALSAGTPDPDSRGVELSSHVLRTTRLPHLRARVTWTAPASPTQVGSSLPADGVRAARIRRGPLFRWPSAKSIAVSLEASAAEKAQDRQHDDDNDDDHDEGEDAPPFNTTGRGRSSTELIDHLPSRDHQTHHGLRGTGIRPAGPSHEERGRVLTPPAHQPYNPDSPLIGAWVGSHDTDR